MSAAANVSYVTMSGQYKHPGAGAGTQTVGPRPTNRTRGDLGPDNFCGEIKVLESDRFLFSQHLSNSGRDWASLMSGNVAAIMFTRVTVLTI